MRKVYYSYSVTRAWKDTPDPYIHATGRLVMSGVQHITASLLQGRPPLRTGGGAWRGGPTATPALSALDSVSVL